MDGWSIDINVCFSAVSYLSWMVDQLILMYAFLLCATCPGWLINWYWCLKFCSVLIVLEDWSIDINVCFSAVCYPEFDISVSKLLGLETFWFFLMVSVSVSENFGIEKSIGIGFGKIWYRKKYRYRFRKFLVSKKVSVSKNLVSKKYQILKQEILSKISRGGDACFCRWPEILSKISRGGGACFCQSGNPLKNIKGWRCFFLLMTGNPLKNIKGWRCLLEKRDDSLEVDDDD